jgi:hypothetical protein
MKYFISFKDAIKLFDNNYIKIPLNVVANFEPHILYGDIEEDDPEIIQVFLSNITEEYVNILMDLFPNIKFKYFEHLEGYLLLVEHCGTPWSSYNIIVNTKSEYFQKLFYEGSFNRKLLKN